MELGSIYPGANKQNWIGGSIYNPCHAEFIPPPPEYIEPLLQDLCNFCNDDALPALVQSAIAHAQFETIHPFVDGNGRVGRALIQMILRRRGLAPRIVPPISLILATRSKAYIGALTATRYRGSATSSQAQLALNQWIGEFALCTLRAVQNVEYFEGVIGQIRLHWLELIGELRSDAAARLLLEMLPGTPIISVRTASSFIQRSFKATNQAISILLEHNILKERHANRRNRIFEAPEIIEAFTNLERQLASPASDTRLALPLRSVPQRKRR